MSSFTYISLCSGIGGLDIAMQSVGGRCVAYCEIDSYCQEVLLRRMEEGWLDMAPIVDGIQFADWPIWGGVDCVVAGFPCQPFSVAGARKGGWDRRNVWPEVAEVVSATVPPIVFLENVPGTLHYFSHTIVRQLEEMGYGIAPPIITTAAEVGAGHIRRRLFLLAYTSSGRTHLQPRRGARQSWEETVEFESALSKARLRCREGNGGADGTPFRVDRLRALGNAVVWQQARLAWELLTQPAPRGETE